jgi:hypothetical protein
MSFQQILLIWLALTLVAAVIGSIAHLVGGSARHLSDLPRRPR